MPRELCRTGMKSLGYIGWAADPNGARLKIRGLVGYKYDLTNSDAILAAVERVRPSIFHRAGTALSAARSCCTAIFVAIAAAGRARV